MRILSGVTDQYVYFVAVDATDYVTRETGLSSFTVYRSRNGGAAAAMTTPTINETDTTNMPGVYELLLDEDMTIDAGDDTQEIVFHITHAGMAPVTRTIELYRAKVTAGNTLGVAADGDVSGNVDGAVGSVTGNVGGSTASVTGAVGSVTGAVGSVASGGITAASLATDAITAAKIAADAITSSELAASAIQEIADGLLDRTDGVEPASGGTERTVREAMRLMLAALCGKASGLATATATYRDTNDGTDRIVATVDADGNRTAVTLDDT